VVSTDDRVRARARVREIVSALSVTWREIVSDSSVIEIMSASSVTEIVSDSSVTVECHRDSERLECHRDSE
jgi:hypothetical protein